MTRVLGKRDHHAPGSCERITMSFAAFTKMNTLDEVVVRLFGG
jgi:hypothetical protein